MAESQRRFAVMGKNAFKMVNAIASNQRLCRLLKYQNRNPFSSELDDVAGEDLINKQILIAPKLFDENDEKMSFIVAVFDNYVVNTLNHEFKISTIRFDVICPLDEWFLDEESLRPYLMLQELDQMFNEAKMAGIGTLQFHRMEPLTLSPQLGGYSLYYKINDFN